MESCKVMEVSMTEAEKEQKKAFATTFYPWRKNYNVSIRIGTSTARADQQQDKEKALAAM
jgi:hypothetical protein